MATRCTPQVAMPAGCPDHVGAAAGVGAALAVVLSPIAAELVMASRDLPVAVASEIAALQGPSCKAQACHLPDDCQAMCLLRAGSPLESLSESRCVNCPQATLPRNEQSGMQAHRSVLH